MEYHFKIHKEAKGYWAECLELPGCVAQAESLKELETAMSESLNLFLSESENSDILFPAPQDKKGGRSLVAVEVDPSVAIALNVRQARLRMNKTQKQMMDFLGIKTLSNYQRLEDPKRANPEFKTLIALTKALPSLRLGAVIESYRKKSKAS